MRHQEGAVSCPGQIHHSIDDSFPQFLSIFLFYVLHMNIVTPSFSNYYVSSCLFPAEHHEPQVIMVCMSGTLLPMELHGTHLRQVCARLSKTLGSKCVSTSSNCRTLKGKMGNTACFNNIHSDVQGCNPITKHKYFCSKHMQSNTDTTYSQLGVRHF